MGQPNRQTVRGVSLGDNKLCRKQNFFWLFPVSVLFFYIYGQQEAAPIEPPANPLGAVRPIISEL